MYEKYNCMQSALFVLKEKRTLTFNGNIFNNKIENYLKPKNKIWYRFLKRLSHFQNFMNTNLITRQQFPGNQLRSCTLSHFLLG